MWEIGRFLSRVAFFFFFQAEDGIRYWSVTGVQTCALPIYPLDYPKGEALEHQGDRAMEQYFIIEGILKRVVSNAQGKEMILRFAAESDIDTSYAAWRLKTPLPYSIRAVTKVRAAKLSMQHWVEFLECHAAIKSAFEFEIMKLMSEVMAHTI